LGLATGTVWIDATVRNVWIAYDLYLRSLAFGRGNMVLLFDREIHQ